MLVSLAPNLAGSVCVGGWIHKKQCGDVQHGRNSTLLDNFSCQTAVLSEGGVWCLLQRPMLHRPDPRAPGPLDCRASWKDDSWFNTWSRGGESPGLWSVRRRPSCVPVRPDSLSEPPVQSWLYFRYRWCSCLSRVHPVGLSSFLHFIAPSLDMGRSALNGLSSELWFGQVS